MAGYDNTAYWVYIDEFGTVTKKDISSNLYIEVAVFVKDEERKDLENSIDEICNQLCDGAELKSSKIAGNHRKRLKILTAIDNLPFQYIALVCNKNLINENSGLQYKTSCYKFLHKKLNLIFKNLSGNIKFLLDKYGSFVFQEGCKTYFTKSTQELFFSEASYDFISAHENRLIQLAYFIAGTLSYCLDVQRKEKQYTPKFHSLLRRHEIDLYCYPRLIKPVSEIPPKQNDVIFANELRNRLYNQAQIFLEKNEESIDENIQMQWYTLKSLFDASEYEK